MKKELVIAGYDKPLEWLNDIQSDVKITIYRKGNAPISKFKEIKVETNIGRCVHTFFNHIYLNYENLSDITFFAQDYPFDHWGNIVKTINENLWVQNSILNINDGYFGFYNNGIYGNLFRATHFNNGNVLSCAANGHPHDGQPGLNVDRYWHILFDQQNPNYYEFIPAGHFGITKSHATIRTKCFYGKIKELLETESIAPWIIERLECYIFDPRYKAKII